MTDETNILIHTASDIVTARMEVREAARRYGMSLIDQACISMAISSIAKNLISNNTDFRDGSISIECLQKGTQIGIRVTSLWKGIEYQPPTGTNERWMVDEIEAHSQGDGSYEIILTKWAEKLN